MIAYIIIGVGGFAVGFVLMYGLAVIAAGRSRRRKATPKRTMQFSQKMTLISAVFSMVFVVGINAANFVLLWCEKQPMPQEAVTAMTIYGGITSTLTFGGYCALSGVRDCSLNKTKCVTNAPKIERGMGQDEEKD